MGPTSTPTEAEYGPRCWRTMAFVSGSGLARTLRATSSTASLIPVSGVSPRSSSGQPTSAACRTTGGSRQLYVCPDCRCTHLRPSSRPSRLTRTKRSSTSTFAVTAMMSTRGAVTLNVQVTSFPRVRVMLLVTQMHTRRLTGCSTTSRFIVRHSTDQMHGVKVNPRDWTSTYLSYVR